LVIHVQFFGKCAESIQGKYGGGTGEFMYLNAITKTQVVACYIVFDMFLKTRY